MVVIWPSILAVNYRCQNALNSRFRFGSFNHARKLTQSTIDLFCKVMAKNPESELALKSISFCEPAEKQRIRQRFEQAGLKVKD